MGSTIASDVRGELKGFFAKVGQWFWVFGLDTRPDNSLPRTPRGSVKEAILLSHGLAYGELTKLLWQLQEIFPEMDEHIWENGLIIVENTQSRPQEKHLANRRTTIRRINEFLISDMVLDLLRASFPSQMAAMEAEETRRLAAT